LLLVAAQANSLVCASALSGQSEIQLGSALTRFYRFLRNERFDNWLLTERLIGLLAERKKVVLCLDWTKWKDKFSLLAVSVCVEKRSLPIFLRWLLVKIHFNLR
jgi:predicted ATPase